MKFIKKPIEIEAVQWTGSNWPEIVEFQGASIYEIVPSGQDNLIIYTLEGNMKALPGDWIIRGVEGELYPCKPDIFEKTYQQGGVENISDGYHTFKELYEHRIALYIALCRYYGAAYQLSGGEANPVWRSKCHSDGKLCFGGDWFVLGINTVDGQITYHLPIVRWEETAFAKTLDKAPEWDGHTSADVLERLKNL